jgi:hypothetical protein
MRSTVYALDETGTCNRFSVMPEGGFVRDVEPTDETELLANAKLISQAPEMLALLEEIARRYNPKTSRWARKALPVIAKARGEQ